MLQWGHDKIVMEVGGAGLVVYAAIKLQWGHDKIVMEVFSLTEAQKATWELQWGHDKIVMEVSRDRGLEQRRLCFNGAMTK